VTTDMYRRPNRPRGPDRLTHVDRRPNRSRGPDRLTHWTGDRLTHVDPIG